MLLFWEHNVRNPFVAGKRAKHVQKNKYYSNKLRKDDIWHHART